jgi:hypothetical protein
MKLNEVFVNFFVSGLRGLIPIAILWLILIDGRYRYDSPYIPDLKTSEYQVITVLREIRAMIALGCGVIAGAIWLHGFQKRS